MNITVFASLKNYYSETFEINKEGITSVALIKEALIKINPAASHILKSCRFAVNEEFVSNDFQLIENEHIYIIPPSSGG